MNDLLKNVEDMKVKECRTELDEHDPPIKYGKKEKLPALQKKVGDTRKSDGGVHPANDPFCEIFSNPKAGHPACLSCLKKFGKRYDACMEVAEAAKKAKVDGKTGGPSSKVKGKYTNFDELKSSLEKAPDKRLTMVVDKLLLEGLSIPAILSEVEDRKKDDFSESKDFKSAAIIQKHIRFRASKGWVFTITPGGTVQLTGYSGKEEKVSFTAPSKPEEKPAEPDKKAA